ncbi:hypothetical protein HYDPIDRAFT_39597 [Hydnomerulius pinastri MD-312]|nr:hypothetical protein HYDPIDRAFT_39597 [Hydnomerulius pinastri MD-312]
MITFRNMFPPMFAYLTEPMPAITRQYCKPPPIWTPSWQPDPDPTSDDGKEMEQSPHVLPSSLPEAEEDFANTPPLNYNGSSIYESQEYTPDVPMDQFAGGSSREEGEYTFHPIDWRYRRDNYGREYVPRISKPLAQRTPRAGSKELAVVTASSKGFHTSRVDCADAFEAGFPGQPMDDIEMDIVHHTHAGSALLASDVDQFMTLDDEAALAQLTTMHPFEDSLDLITNQHFGSTTDASSIDADPLADLRGFSFNLEGLSQTEIESLLAFFETRDDSGEPTLDSGNQAAAFGGDRAPIEVEEDDDDFLSLLAACDNPELHQSTIIADRISVSYDAASSELSQAFVEDDLDT